MGASMTKILLVEDDKSLREIYGVRLLAEGYEIVSAGDGEEALAMAVKEKPGLIISDVMMPKISGFDMLDILRSTPETKDVKVIMMTALSSEDQRARGEALGANRYLVKSQVGIEDVVRTVHDVLADSPIPVAPVPQAFGAQTPTARTLQPVISMAPNYVQRQAQANIPAPVQAQPQNMQNTNIGQMQDVTPVQAVAPAPAPTPTYTPSANPMAQPFTAPIPAAPAAAPMAPAVPITPTRTITPEPVYQPTVEPVQLPQPTAPFSTSPASSMNNQPTAYPPQPAPVAASTPDIATLIAQELNNASQTPPIPPQS